VLGAAGASAADHRELREAEREQFGSPIGRFQGVKHPLAEMLVDVESAKSILYYAACAIDERDPDAARAVSLAKAYASEAFAAHTASIRCSCTGASATPGNTIPIST